MVDISWAILVYTFGLVSGISFVILFTKMTKDTVFTGVPYSEMAAQEAEKYLYCSCQYEEKFLIINRIHNPKCRVHKMRLAKIK